MKQYLKIAAAALLILLVTAPLAAQRKKVGVVLSGGGAKGIVHIGALKVIEEAGIPIDYIAGTSMGAIIGGLYAIGYDVQTLDSLVHTQNWPELLGDRVPRRDQSLTERELRDKFILTVPLNSDKKLFMPSGFVAGSNIYNLLAELTVEYNDSISFSQLPIPFTCVAYDLTSGKSVRLDHGFLPEAIRASMSIPGAFEPVNIDGMMLIDGGITNNFPTDAAKDMGADIIIGVDVAAGAKDAEHLKSFPDVLTQITWFIGLENYERNYNMCDVYIHPDIEGFTAASFTEQAVDTLLVRGERAAREKWEELLEVKRELGLPMDYKPDKLPPVELGRKLEIAEIRFEGLNRYTQSTLMRVCGIKGLTEMSTDEIQSSINRLQGISGISEVNFRLEGNEPYRLVYTVKESSRNYLNLGIRFDSEEMAAILLSASFGPSKIPNARYTITARLSENPYLLGAFILGNETDRIGSLSYRIKYNNIDIYHRGDKQSNLNFWHHTADLNFSNIRFHNFLAGAGLKFDLYNYRNNLSIAEDFKLNVDFDRLISYYANVMFESLDSKYAPRKGFHLKAEYTLYTTDFYSNKGGNPFSAISLDMLGAVSVSRRVTFLPGLFGRVLIGKNIPFPALNMLGGNVDGRYMPQQFSFVGMNKLETFEHSVVGGRLDFRVRLWRKNFVSLRTNYLFEANDFWDILDNRGFWGVGLAYSYNTTVLGPIELQVDYSNRTKSLGAYLNIGYYF